MSLLGVTTPVYVIRGGEGLVSKEKVLFFPLNYYDQSFQSHWRAFSGLLRASIAKGRSPLLFQFEQILGFLICVHKPHGHQQCSFSPHKSEAQ